MERSVLIGVVLGVVCLILLAWVTVLHLRLQRLHRTLVLLQANSSEQDFVEVVAEHVAHVQALDEHVGVLDGHVQQLRDALAGAVQRIGVVRYDAFADMGGHLSFSAAFLDEHGSGIVLTCINGRTDSRIYSKPVTAAQDSAELSDEELAAIQLAMAGPQRVPEIA
ncbi:MAG: DUF4446 family protein [Acidimicrobiia bacterium]|nr:DUF4446 family protein [Acidimicrobiia bacterium]